MPSSSKARLQELLAQSSWLEELAMRLVGDINEARDLAQSTHLAALQKPPPGPMQRGWLATVMRNLQRQQVRRETRRRERERLAAKHEALPSPELMVAKAEAQRRVVDAVLALGEPYQSVILWRYFENKPPREIARSQGLPLATVNSQLQRALGKLRGQLQQDFGESDSRAWTGLLLPLIHCDTSILAGMSIGGGFGAPKSLLITLVAAACLLGSLLLYLAPEQSTDMPSESRSSARPELRQELQVAREDGPGTERLTLTTNDLAPASAGESQRNIKGLVFDSFGRALPDLPLHALGEGLDTIPMRSDAKGAFSLVTAKAPLEVRSADPAWVTVIAGLVSRGVADSEVPVVAVLAPAISLAGQVLNPAGKPLAQVQLSILPPAELAARIPESLDASRRLHGAWHTATDETGRFELAGIPAISGAKVILRRDGYLPLDLVQPEESQTGLSIRMQGSETTLGLIAGQVLDPAGYPVPDARVCLGAEATDTDASGMFSIEVGTDRGELSLHALKRGYLPAHRLLAAEEAKAAGAFYYLHLPAPSAKISGLLVDRRGQPIAAARIWIHDGELLPGLNGSIEGYAHGGLTDDELRDVREPSGASTASMDELKEAYPNTLWAWTRSNARGEFELGGLQDRSYALRVLREDPLQIFDSHAIPAGSSHVRIVFAPETRERIAGRVQTLDGQALLGIDVEFSMWTVQRRMTYPSGKSMFTGDAFTGPRQTSDEAGYFEFANPGRQPGFLVLSGEQIMNQFLPFDANGMQAPEFGPLENLRLRVPRRMHFRIDLADDQAATSLAMLNAADEALPIASFQNEGRTSKERWAILNGRSQVLAVSEEAVTLALYKEATEVQRSKLNLRAGMVNRIER